MRVDRKKLDEWLAINDLTATGLNRFGISNLTIAKICKEEDVKPKHVYHVCRVLGCDPRDIAKL